MRTLFIYGVLVGATAWLVISQLTGFNNDIYRAKLDYAKYICDYSHNVPTGDTETECGRLQAETHTEYLCNQTNTACWLEVK